MTAVKASRHDVHGAPPLAHIVLSCILNFHRVEIPLPQFGLSLDLASVKAPHFTIAIVK